MEPAETLHVELVWSPCTGDVQHRNLTVAAGCTVVQALHQCADFASMLERLEDYKLGVWGRVKALDTVLRERDRIEVYRALTVDPKEARRQRYRAKGERIVSRHRPLAGKTTR